MNKTMSSCKKGIAIVFDGTLKSIGGAERFAMNLLKIYEILGLKPLLFMFGNELRILRSNGSMIIEVPAMKIMKRSIVLSNIRLFKTILWIMKSVDIIHVLYCESPVQLLITLLGKLWGKKIISSPLASLSFLFHHSKLKALLSVPLVFIKLIIAKLADIVHIASLYDYRYLRSLNSSIVIIPHSFSVASKLIDNFHTNEARQSVDNSFSSHVEGIRLCFLGRFSEDKGSLITLEALRMLRNKLGMSVYLIIIGPKIHVLKSLINYVKKYGLRALKEVLPYVYVTGYLPEEDKYRFLKKCYVGLVPSISDAVEAFSIALSEFNAFGIPVVASAVGALKYRMKPYAGILVKPKDPKALAKGVIRALSLNTIRKLPDVILLKQEVSLWERVLRKLLNG